MIAASTYFPKESSSTIAASSIQGTGSQNLVSAMRNGCRVVSGTAFGPDFSSRLRASSLVRPVEFGIFLTGDWRVAEFSMSYFFNLWGAAYCTFLGALYPFCLASESPMAMAYFLLLTVFPLPPLFNVPRLNLCIASSTVS